MSTDMDDIFTRPGTDLCVRVRVDDQLLRFEWDPEKASWDAVDINEQELHLDLSLMCDIVSKPMWRSWACLY
jgi:hypothetical protein